MTAANPTKPPYRVPSMDEIRALPWNGYNAVSTFSGCGGSSTGYRMAGFKVRWASEFIPAAQDSYRANMAPYTVLDTRDIRQVQPEDILRAAGLDKGEIDLFDGSPPCAAFSTAGKREAGWGKVKKYSDSEQRVDDLFHEFARLVKGCQPRIFIAENVSGLVKGTAKGYFLEILAALKACGYRVSAKVLDAQWLGVPQSRQRLIFCGVREDLRGADGRPLMPAHPTPLAYQYTVRDALPWVRRQGGNGSFGEETWQDAGAHPSPTIGASTQTGNGRSPPSMIDAYTGLHPAARVMDDTGGQPQYSGGDITDRPSVTVLQEGAGKFHVHGEDGTTERRKFSIAELRRICGFPDDYILTGTYAQQWERCGRAVPPVMMSHIAATARGLLDVARAGAATRAA